MKEPIDAYFSTDAIKKLAAKVVSVRSLDYEVFKKHVESLMEECYQTGYEVGYAARGEDEYWNGD